MQQPVFLISLTGVEFLLINSDEFCIFVFTDRALTRPGRFDSKVIVPVPDVRGRKDIIELYLKTVSCGDGKCFIHREFYVAC